MGVVMAATTATAQSTPAPPPEQPTGCSASTPREQVLQGWRAQTQGQWITAEACLRAATVTPDAWVQRHRHELDYSLGIVEQRVGALHVTGGVPGAHVLLDGVPIGTLPMASPVRVLAGSTRLRVIADGYYPVERTITVAPGDIPSVEAATMGPLPAEVPDLPVERPSPLPTIRLATMPTVVQPALEGHTTHGDSHPGGLLRSLAWAAGVGGILGLGTGIAGTWLTETGADHYVQICTGQVPASTVPMCPGLRATAVSNQGLGVALETAGYLTAGLLMAATVALFVAAASRDAHRSSVAFRCGAGPGAVGILCGVNLP